MAEELAVADWAVAEELAVGDDEADAVADWADAEALAVPLPLPLAVGVGEATAVVEPLEVAEAEELDEALDEVVAEELAVADAESVTTCSRRASARRAPSVTGAPLSCRVAVPPPPVALASRQNRITSTTRMC